MILCSGQSLLISASFYRSESHLDANQSSMFIPMNDFMYSLLDSLLQSGSPIHATIGVQLMTRLIIEMNQMTEVWLPPIVTMWPIAPPPPVHPPAPTQVWLRCYISRLKFIIPSLGIERLRLLSATRLCIQYLKSPANFSRLPTQT